MNIYLITGEQFAEYFLGMFNFSKSELDQMRTEQKQK